MKRPLIRWANRVPMRSLDRVPSDFHWLTHDLREGDSLVRPEGMQCDKNRTGEAIREAGMSLIAKQKWMKMMLWKMTRMMLRMKWW